MTSVLIRSTVARNVCICCVGCWPATLLPASAAMAISGIVRYLTVGTPFGRPAGPFGWRERFFRTGSGRPSLYERLDDVACVVGERVELQRKAETAGSL